MSNTSNQEINNYNDNEDDKINDYNENEDYIISNYNQNEVDNNGYDDREYINNSSYNSENDELYEYTEIKTNDYKGKKNKKFHKRTYKDGKAIKNVLLKQSNDIKKEYKQSIFNDVINGPHGPDVRLHKHNIMVGLLKLFLVLYFTAGIILLSVISLCITINVGYVCVQIDDTNSIVQMIFFVFYFNVLYSIIHSFWKTYLRLVHTISKSKFGSSVNDMFIKRVLGYFITKKIAKLVILKKYKSHPKDWYEKLNLLIFGIFLFIVFLPFPIVAYIYGYWEVVSMFCIFFVIGGTISIIAINAFSRIIQFIKLFSRLNEFYYNAPYYVNLDERAKNQTNFLRLAYCTTNGLHGGCNLFNHILNQLIFICAQISLASFFFGSFDPDVIKVSISLGLLIIILPLRFRKKIYKAFINIGVNLHLFSDNSLKVDELEDKTKINDKMKATHKQYLNSIKNTIIINSQKKYMNSDGYNFDYNTMNINECSEKSEEYQNQNNIISNQIENNNNSKDNKIDDDNNNSNYYENNIKNTNNDSSNNNGNTDENIKNNNNDNNNNNNNEIPIYINQMDNTHDQKDNPNINNEHFESSQFFNEEENKINLSFYNLINSKNPYFHGKAILKWNIDTLTSWKGCLTIFSLRIIKFVVGITFMAILNYSRYSEHSDTKETNHNLQNDIITHIIFVIVLLLQDIIFLIPASTEIMSMKTRKYSLNILLVMELILVTVMRAVIVNNYIPMAFILIAYANFTVHPDPRYDWDDEDTERKTLFDLFNPKINFDTETSHKNHKKARRFSRKYKIRFSNIYRRLSKDKKKEKKGKEIIRNNSNTSDNSDETNNHNNNNNNNNNNNLSNYNKNHSYRETSNYKLNKQEGNNKRNMKPKDKFYRVIKGIRKEMQYKRNSRAYHNSAIILLAITFTVIISLVLSIKFSESGKKTIYTLEDFIEDKNELTNQKPAICQWRADGISINEFCALAYACYYKNIENVNNSWLFSRPKSSKNTFTVGDNNVTSKTGVHFVDFINKESNVLVVAIRGTLTMEDIFQDCYIWSASGLLQISGYFGTFINFWPREITATLVNLIVKQFTNLQLLYWVDIEKHIKELQMNTNYTLYLTGHSLGGGVAAVIASHLNIPAITFSSPGLGYSYKTYDIELKKLMRNLVNVIPMSDPIPKLDSQVGEIQYIECKTGHPFACHRIMNTLDTLNNLCHEDAVYRYWDEHTEKTLNGVPVKHNLYP